MLEKGDIHLLVTFKCQICFVYVFFFFFLLLSLKPIAQLHENELGKWYENKSIQMKLLFTFMS